MREYESKFITTAGYQTHYIEAGEGKPLILLHGGGAGADARGNWTGPCLDILSKERRVIALDMVGFGQSDAPDPDEFDYTVESRVDQLIAFIEVMNLAPVDIVGNSMGGRTSAGVAIDRPDLIDKLILMGSAGRDTSMGGALRALVEYDFTYEGMERIVRALTNDGYEPDPKMVEYRTNISKQPAQAKAFSATMKILKERVGMAIEPEEIAKIKHQTLVINGKNDKVIPIEQAYEFLALIENSTGVFLPHCGHWAMIEHPEKFANITLRFLSGEL